MSGIVRFKDFSSPEDEEIPSFRIAPDTFTCLPEIPLDVLIDMGEAAQSSSETGMARIRKMMEIFEGVLVPESYEIFARRLRRSTVAEPNPHPIGMKAVTNLLPWLMEVYGLRPTEESSSSPDGSDADDTSSTDGASLTASTS